MSCSDLKYRPISLFPIFIVQLLWTFIFPSSALNSEFFKCVIKTAADECMLCVSYVFHRQIKSPRKSWITSYQGQNSVYRMNSGLFDIFLLRSFWVYSQYWPASAESGERFNSKYTTKHQRASHAGNGGTDRHLFSALQRQRLCILISRLENEESISVNRFGSRLSVCHVRLTIHDV